MKHNYYDLHVHAGNIENKGEIARVIENARRLGWAGICLTGRFDSNSTSNSKSRSTSNSKSKFNSNSNTGKIFRELSETISDIKENAGGGAKETEPDILLGAEICAGNGQDVRKNARKALKYADIILVHGGDDGINRAASECWEIDILCHPERGAQKDFMDQKNSGIDHIMARFLAERGIAIELVLSDILNSYGAIRSMIMGRMRQNIMLARKYNVPVIITSNAHEKWGMRAPRDLMAVGIMLGMNEKEARAAVCEIPFNIIKKSRDRSGPDVIMKGLEVVSWGELKPLSQKKMFGWY